MNKHAKLLRSITAAASLLLLLLLAWMCLDIYLDGLSVMQDHPFTREKVGAKLSPMLPAFILYAVLVAVTAFSGRAESPKPAMSAENRLRLMKARLSELPAEAMQEEEKRRKLRLAGTAALAVLAIPCLVYLLNGENFVSWDLEQVMGDMLLAVLPWVIIGFALLIALDHLMKKSIEQELEIIKAQAVKAVKKAEPIPEKKDRTGIVRIAILCTAVLFIALGVSNGGLRDVLVKAINICTECIGLG